MSLLENQIGIVNFELAKLAEKAKVFGKDAETGARAAILESGFEDIISKIKALDDEITYYAYQFEPIDVEKLRTAKYVVCKKGLKLVFLLGEGDSDGHLLIAERHGFKKEHCLGGGFLKYEVEPFDMKFQLYGTSTSLGPNMVYDKTEAALRNATSFCY